MAASAPRMSVSQIIEEGLRVHFPEMPAAERDDTVVNALREVGLDPDARFRYPHEFSGGQRQPRRHRPRHGAQAQFRRAR